MGPWPPGRQAQEISLLHPFQAPPARSALFSRQASLMNPLDALDTGDWENIRTLRGRFLDAVGDVKMA